MNAGFDWLPQRHRLKMITAEEYFDRRKQEMQSELFVDYRGQLAYRDKKAVATISGLILLPKTVNTALNVRYQDNLIALATHDEKTTG